MDERSLFTKFWENESNTTRKVIARRLLFCLRVRHTLSRHDQLRQLIAAAEKRRRTIAAQFPNKD